MGHHGLMDRASASILMAPRDPSSNPAQGEQFFEETSLIWHENNKVTPSFYFERGDITHI